MRTLVGLGAVLPLLACNSSEALEQVGLALAAELGAAPTPQAPAPQAPAPQALRSEPRAERVLTTIEQRAPEPESAQVCAEGMVLVEGMYCPKVQHTCERYMTPYGRYAKYRCAKYGKPQCASPRRERMSFCIDQDEYTKAGERLPQNHKSLVQAAELCAAQGKRVCTESEWNFACEGEEMRPYPYGFERDASACNADRSNILTPGRALKDLRAPSDAFPRCVSPFGVRNLSGNLEEFVLSDDSASTKPVMKGAWWQPGRNACRSRQTVHGARYSGIETGFRCCSSSTPPTPD